jgi:divalent metal cation (Fe/Co/Zn/Cd) transporter
MARALASTNRTAAVAIAVAVAVLLLPTSGLVQLGILVLAAVAGLVLAQGGTSVADSSAELLDVSRRVGLAGVPQVVGTRFGEIMG